MSSTDSVHVGPQHYPDHLSIPVTGAKVPKVDAATIDSLRGVSAATASAELHQMGVRQTFIQGPESRLPGSSIIGNAVTLQFMPQREDIASGQGQEQAEKKTALWQVLDEIEPGDVLVVQAYGDMYTGVLGEMLITYLKGRGGIGLVADGCIRDWPKVRNIGLPLWTLGATPNYSSQASLFPWGYNVPVALGRVTVLPGDIIIADDDGAVAVPRKMAADLAVTTTEHEEWEEFSRLRLAEGGSIAKYYPLNAEGEREYQQWRSEQKR